MGRIKFILCFKKKQAKNSIFVPEIARKVELSDPARNSYFPADFWVPAYSVLRNWGNIEPLYGRGGGSAE